MKKAASIRKNFIYNIMYQLLLLIVPLITVPYVSRMLGADGVGINSYTYSIAYYFVLVAMLGINNHGNRAIARVRDNKGELSKTFLSIYAIQVFMSCIMTVFYLIYVSIFSKQYHTIAYIQALFLLANIIDINWFFFGMEKFKIAVTRNSIIKIISLIAIFCFVKSKNDVWIYALILSLTTLLANALLLPSLFREIDIVKIDFNDVKKHLKPVLLLFIPVVAISLYKIMDKIMLGIFTNMSEVGYYEQAEKIVNIPVAIATALGTVMLPRISNLVSKGHDETIKKYIKKSIDFMMFLAFPMCFGLISISKSFIPIFLGEGFVKSAILLNYLSITILFISFANVIRKQWLVPKEMDKTYIVSVLLGAGVNLILNLILIPKMYSIGACIGTIAAEFAVMIYQIIAVHASLPICEYLKSILKFFVTSLVMFAIVKIIGCLFCANIYTIVIQIFVGVLVYFVLNIKYINSIYDIKSLFMKVKKNKE